MADQLFVYGTLHPDRAPAEIADAVKELRPVGKGTVRGRLYDLGEFPGLVVDGSGDKKISGSIFALPGDPRTLAAIDEYEDFRPEDPANSLFLRTRRRVTLSDGSQRLCWVYVYNGELPRAS